jgi:hypothetical protein
LQIRNYTLFIPAQKATEFQRTRLNMNLKVILSAVGAAALLAAPAVAKTRHVPPAPVQADRAPAPHAAVTPYAADLPVPAHKVNGVNPDFQSSPDK